MTATRRKLSWEPIRLGDVFCAPACGRGCTFDEYTAAHDNGAALAGYLGEGWTWKVHENLGWHFQAISPCGRIKVVGNRRHGYTAFLGEVDFPGGRWSEHGKLPEQAVAAVLRKAKVERDEIAQLLNGLEDA